MKIPQTSSLNCLHSNIAILSLAIPTYSSDMSQPKYFLLLSIAILQVVPLPHIGSKTKSPSLDQLKI